MHYLRWGYRQVLSLEVVPGTIWHKKLRAQFRTPSQLTNTRGGRIQQEHLRHHYCFRRA